jgi:osmoprotectant transport system permease protein
MVWICLTLFGAALACTREPDTVRIGAKNFTEEQILGEMMAQTLEAHTSLAVERHFQLGGTQLAFEALRGGAIDMYPEYTGTGFVTILKEAAPTDRAEARRIVDARFRARFGIAWLPTFGFDDTHVLAVRADDPRLAVVKTISDLARRPDLRLGITHEFMDRADGMMGLAERYGIQVSDEVVSHLDPGLLYEAIASGRVNAIVVYSTDARIAHYGLRLLKDDRAYFPPYEAAPLATLDLLARHPEVVGAMDRLHQIATEDDMRTMSYAVDVAGEDAASVVTDFLFQRGIVPEATVRGRVASRASFLPYFWDNRAYVAQLMARHLLLTLVALFVATVVGTGFGFAVARHERLAAFVFPIVGTFQTVPSLALLGFLVPIVGIGVGPALIALFFYALLPIVRSTHAGIRSVDPRLCDVGRGLGLSDGQILRHIEIPLALPTILSGVRTSAVILVGTATLASLVGAGGLGDPIFRGLSNVKAATILLGAIPAAVLALALDRVLGLVERFVVSPGLRRRRNA